MDLRRRQRAFVNTNRGERATEVMLPVPEIEVVMAAQMQPVTLNQTQQAVNLSLYFSSLIRRDSSACFRSLSFLSLCNLAFKTGAILDPIVSSNIKPEPELKKLKGEL